MKEFNLGLQGSRGLESMSIMAGGRGQRAVGSGHWALGVGIGSGQRAAGVEAERSHLNPQESGRANWEWYELLKPQS